MLGLESACILAADHARVQSLPAEVYPEYTTLEYQVPRARVVHPPAYVFVVDTCLPEDELAACRAALSQVCPRL